MHEWKAAVLLCLLVVLPLAAAELEPGEVACGRCAPFVGDFNGDGLDDLLVRNEIRLNVNGQFAPGIVVDAINADDNVRAVLDVNADGLADVIVARRSSSTGPGQPWTAPGADRLLVNIGSGRFIRGSALPGGGVLQAADFTGDRNADLVLFSGDGFVLARGTGVGTFVAVQTLPFPDGRKQSVNDPFGIGDLNGDGRPDLVLPRQRDLFFYFATADGRFSEPVKRYTHLEPRDVNVADVNGDSKRDIVFISRYQQQSRLTVLFGDGTGHFPRVAHVRVPVADVNHRDPDPRTIAVADFYPGGAHEIAVGAGPGDVVVYSASADRLVEIARLDAPRLLQPDVRAGQFRREPGVDLLVLGHLPLAGNEAQIVFTDGTLGVSQAQEQRRPRSSRNRAVGHLSSGPGIGEYHVSVSGACGVAISGRWNFVREGLFLDVTGVRGLQKVEAAVIDNEVAVRLFINDMGTTRVLEGSLFPAGNGLKGQLFENNPPCGGAWTWYEVEATR